MRILTVIVFTMLIFFGCGSSSRGSDAKDKDLSLQLPTDYPVKNIDIPTCTQSNPKVQFIQTKSDWLIINSDSSKSIFCVKPGNYRTGEAVLIKRSGTSEQRLYIVLDNGNNEHPAKLNINQLANVDLQFEDSNYWVVDRMVSIGSTGIEDSPVLFMNSSHNIINRHFVDKSSGGITIRDDSNDNTIQNSILQNMSDLGLKNDKSAIIFEPRDSVSEIKNTQIIHNEIYNCNDGIHLLWRESISRVKYDGTIIYDNDISVDSALYTNCAGQRDVAGECSYSENAIDIKSGSYDSKNPIVVKNNRLWGFRKSDQTGSTLEDPGVAIVMHYGVKYIEISDNTIFDSVQGILSVDKRYFDYALLHANIAENSMFNIAFPLVLTEAEDTMVSKNYIVNSLNAWLVLDGSDKLTVTNNEIINKKSVDVIEDKYATNTIIKDNLYFETTNLRDKSFITNKFSNNPITVNPLLQ